MIVYFDGAFVPEHEAMVSIFDRSFRYGDGLFETLLAKNGRFFRWEQHLQRLERSVAFIRLPITIHKSALLAAAGHLLERNAMADAVLRITVSRGAGPRGYLPTGTEKPVLIMTCDTRPTARSPAKVITSKFRVAVGDMLSQHKTSSRLLNVLAAMEARDAGADEALLVDTEGNVTEGATSNIFCIKQGAVYTTPITAGVLPGITRQAIFDLCAKLQVACVERSIPAEGLKRLDGAFLTLTSRGVFEVESVNGSPIGRSAITARLASSLEELIARECS